ncbi:MAG: hypothetical protein LBM99_05940, partial [Bacillales bacterium]|nr:hypothetical protein [Bacillales bacterium]
MSNENGFLFNVVRKVYVYSTVTYDYISTLSKDNAVEYSFEDPLDFQNYLSQSSTGSIETSIPLFSTFALASFTVSG